MIFQDPFQKIMNWRDEDQEWHEWFAFYPVLLDGGDTVWWQKIERKRSMVQKRSLGASFYAKGYDYRLKVMK